MTNTTDNTSNENISTNKSILGQTPLEFGDGYTTAFTCSHSNKTYIEYKQNIGSWAWNAYWGGTMEENGCGITSLAIIASRI